MTNSTFPVIHGLEHPLVVRFLYENPVTTHTVRGVVSESLLHRHAGVNSVIKKKTEATAGSDVVYFMRLLLMACNTASECVILQFSGSVQVTDSDFLPFFFPLLSLTFYAAIFFSPALAKCVPAGNNVRSRHSPLSGLWRGREDSPPGPALLYTPRPHLTEDHSLSIQRKQTSALITCKCKDMQTLSNICVYLFMLQLD